MSKNATQDKDNFLEKLIAILGDVCVRADGSLPTTIDEAIGRLYCGDNAKKTVAIMIDQVHQRARNGGSRSFLLSLNDIQRWIDNTYEIQPKFKLRSDSRRAYKALIRLFDEHNIGVFTKPRSKYGTMVLTISDAYLQSMLKDVSEIEWKLLAKSVGFDPRDPASNNKIVQLSDNVIGSARPVVCV